jgi:predicted MFS family arabinose efflux permease
MLGRSETIDVTTQIKEPVSNSEQAGFGSLFRNKQFMCLWIAQVFSQFADRAVFVLFVAVLTTMDAARAHQLGAAELTSRLYIAFTIPAVLLSPVAGVFVDRWSNKAVLIVSNLMRAGFVALVATPMASKSQAFAFALAFLISIGSQFFGPAETSSIPRLVKPGELYSANSLFFTTMMIALGFGFAIGDPIIKQTGLSNAPWAIAGGFLIAALLLVGISDNRRKTPTKDVWWEELRFGIAYIANKPPVFKAIAKITFLFSTIITLNILAVGLAEQVIHIAAYKFGYIIAAAGIGMGIGNFWVGEHAKNSNPTVVVYTGFTGLGLFMSLLGSLGFIQDYLIPMCGIHNFEFNGIFMSVPLLLASLIGVSCALVAVPTQAALQEAVPEQLRGKVFSAQNTAMSAASTIPVVLAGVSADNLPGGVSTTMLLLGVPTLIFGWLQVSRARAHASSKPS